MHAHVKMPWGVDMKAVAAMAAVMMMVVCVSAQEKQQLGPGPYTETEQKVQRCLDLTSVASGYFLATKCVFYFRRKLSSFTGRLQSRFQPTIIFVLPAFLNSSDLYSSQVTLARLRGIF